MTADPNAGRNAGRNADPAADRERRLHFLLRRLAAAQRRWSLFADGDRVLLGLSGGMDSVTLLHLLARWRRVAPFDFALAALHVEFAEAQGSRERRGRLEDLCGGLDVPLAFAAAEPDQGPPAGVRPAHPCFRCARERRRLLFGHAARHGYGKLALAHHLDDAAETVLMNLLFKGGLEGMPPRRDFFDGRVALVRPLLLAEKSEIARAAAALDFPFVPCLCERAARGIGSERDRAREFLRSLGRHSRAAKRHLLRVSLAAGDGVARP
jgi:tRNA 2-thiocytidine biosynthesis protein TtcA